jgi:predicted acetyltransferase
MDGMINVGEMFKPRLVKPTAELRPSHESMVREFRDHGEVLVPWVLDEVTHDFEDYISWLASASQGVNLPSGHVAHSTFWLVDGDNQIVGVSNIRHELTDALMNFGGHIGYGVRPSARRRGYATEILRLSLVKARAIGIADLRLTCDQDNVASTKTIIKNGGVLDEEVYMAEHGHIVQRYWINAPV